MSEERKKCYYICGAVWYVDKSLYCLGISVCVKHLHMQAVTQLIQYNGCGL